MMHKRRMNPIKCDAHPPGDVWMGPMRSCETNEVVAWGSANAPSAAITRIGDGRGDHVWVCGQCGTWLMQDYADDDFRPMTQEEYSEWRSQLRKP
jgi:hypothetical protein